MMVENYNILDLNICDIIPNNIDNVIIYIENDKHCLFIHPFMRKESYSAWLHQRGGVFSKDVHNFSMKKNHGKYVLMTYKDRKMIVRIIEDNEFERFKSFNLVDGILKDKYYMVLKTMNISQPLTSSKIENLSDIIIEPEIVIPTKTEEIVDIPIETIDHSISLFD